jgi:hypothetical protein
MTNGVENKMVQALEIGLKNTIEISMLTLGCLRHVKQQQEYSNEINLSGRL